MVKINEEITFYVKQDQGVILDCKWHADPLSVYQKQCLDEVSFAFIGLTFSPFPRFQALQERLAHQDCQGCENLCEVFLKSMQKKGYSV